MPVGMSLIDLQRRLRRAGLRALLDPEGRVVQGGDAVMLEAALAGLA